MYIILHIFLLNSCFFLFEKLNNMNGWLYGLIVAACLGFSIYLIVLTLETDNVDQKVVFAFLSGFLFGMALFVSLHYYYFHSSPSSPSSPSPYSWTLSKPILFYDKNEPYYEFTNFVEGFPISIDGFEYPSSEHYYQAMKFTKRPKLMEMIRETERPAASRELAKKYQKLIDPDFFGQRQDRVMQKALLAKFTQHPELYTMLIDTGDSELIEDSPYDAYWGIGKNRDGQNKLGKFLMQLRDQLLKQ